jgi:hypothetical protein
MTTMKRQILLLSALLLVTHSALAAAKIRCSKLVAENVSATKTLDAGVVVQFTPGHARQLADEDHWVEIRFFGPQGYLYESRKVPLTSDAQQTSGTKHFPGYARPIARRLVKASKPGSDLEASILLPVAATSIVTNAMYGTWRAEAYVDDAAEPCAAVTFTISQ